jgi:hypothetical protein
MENAAHMLSHKFSRSRTDELTDAAFGRSWQATDNSRSSK